MLSNIQSNHKIVVENGIEYYTVEGLDIVKKEMLRLLKIIDTIAKANGISYWIDGGSLIGVLRHDGFIPWDDDLDISLLKKDYQKLIEKLTDYVKSNNDAYLFYNYPQDYHVCNFFASRTIFSRTQGSSLAIPVKVDIRPLNCIKNSKESIANNQILRDVANHIIFGKSYGYASDFPKNNKDIRSFFNEYNNEYGYESPTNNSVCLVHPYFEFSSNFELHYNDLFPLKKHRFEDIEVPIPNNYHYIQSCLYGNYMELPSLEHRAPVACKVIRRKISSSLFKNYISHVFGLHAYGLIGKIYNNILMCILLGIDDYIRSRFLEEKVN